jgi:hypothetical protein
MAHEQLIPGESDVLEFIGRHGKTPAQILERFPLCDPERLVRFDLIRRLSIELSETRFPGAPATPTAIYYVLTDRGAEAIGLDPRRLHAA